MITFDHTIAELNRYGDIIRQLYRDKNLNAGYDPDAELQNITFDVENEGNNFSIVFHLPEYWRWAENGRAPYGEGELPTGEGREWWRKDVKPPYKLPPRGSLLQWMEFKHILPSLRPLKSGPNAGKMYLPTMDSLEYIIRKKIAFTGTQGSHTWEATEKEIRDSLIQDVKKALQADFTAYVENMRNTDTKNRK